MDKYTRRVLGWAYGPRKDVALTLRALNSAVRRRRPQRGLVFHTDRGTEYAGAAFKSRLAEPGITQSTRRPTDAGCGFAAATSGSFGTAR